MVSDPISTVSIEAYHVLNNPTDAMKTALVAITHSLCISFVATTT